MNKEGSLPVSLMYEAMDQMQQGVLVIKVTQVQSKIVFVNKAYTRVTGYSKDELLDKPTTYLRKHIAHGKVVAQINHAVNDGQDTEVITPSYSRDGDKYWMRITIHPVVDIGHSDRFLIFWCTMTLAKSLIIESPMYVDISYWKSAIENLKNKSFMTP